MRSFGPHEWDPGVRVWHQFETAVTRMPSPVALSSGMLCPGSMSLPVQLGF